MKKVKLRGKYGIGKFALVDDDIYELAKNYKWFVNCSGYACTKIKCKQVFLHHLPIGRSIIKMDSDHINLNKLDNRRENLRFATRKQNIQNTNKKAGENNSSRFKGVSVDKKRGGWKVNLQVNDKKKWIGKFYDEKQAALAYNIAAVKYFGEFARLNEV